MEWKRNQPKPKVEVGDGVKTNVLWWAVSGHGKARYGIVDELNGQSAHVKWARGDGGVTIDVKFLDVVQKGKKSVPSRGE